MGGVSQRRHPQLAPVDQQLPPRSDEHPSIAPIDQGAGNGAAAELLPIDAPTEGTPTLVAAAREAALEEARADSPASRREADLELATAFSPTRERELELAMARAWGPADEREATLLRAQATAEGVDPDVALLLETRADLMESEGQERLAEAEAAWEDYLARREAAGLH
jgi:hypothetical protein